VTILWGIWILLRGTDVLSVPGWFMAMLTPPPARMPGFAVALVTPALTGLGRAAIRHLALVVALAVLALASARAGGRILGIMPLRGGDWERLFLSLGLGWGVLGMAVYGLSLVGLFNPAAILVLPGLAIVAGGRLPRPVVTADVRKAVAGIVLCSAPFLLVSPLFLVPDTYIDTYLYHLAIPDQCLKAHRFVVDGSNHTFQIPVLAEFLNVYGVLLGNDAFSHFVPLIPYLAGMGLAVAGVAGLAGPVAAGAAAGLALTIQPVTGCILTGKNDLAETGFVVMALALSMRGLPRHAAVTWGLACAVKMNGYAFAGLGWVAHEGYRLWRMRRRWRPDIVWAGLAMLAAGPWLAKSWLLKGDPVWPFLSNWLPGAMWDPIREEALRTSARVAPSLAGMLDGSVRMMMENQPALVLLAPAFVLGVSLLPTPLKAASAFVTGAYLIYMALIRFEFERLSLPLVTFICFPATAAAFRLLEPRSRFVKMATAMTVLAVAWIPVARGLKAASFSPAANVNCLLGSISQERYLETRNTTYGETTREVRALPGLKAVVLVCDARGYRWPCRIRTDDMLGRDIPWVLTRDCGSVARLGVRLRQMNASHIVFNFITESFIWPCDLPYKWDMRQLRLWRDFMKSRTEVAVYPAHSDHQNGGFYVFRIGAGARWHGPGVFYLPGIKPLRWEIHNSRAMLGAGTDPRAAALAYAKLFPDVGIFPMEVARLSTSMRDWRLAYSYSLPWVRAGMVSDASTGAFGQAAFELGRYDEASAALERALCVFTDQRDTSRGLLALVLASQAWVLLEQGGRLGEASELAQRGYGMEPGDTTAGAAFGRVLGELGRCGEAMPLLQRALEGLAPGTQQRAKLEGIARRCSGKIGR